VSDKTGDQSDQGLDLLPVGATCSCCAVCECADTVPVGTALLLKGLAKSLCSQLWEPPGVTGAKLVWTSPQVHTHLVSLTTGPLRSEDLNVIRSESATHNYGNSVLSIFLGSESVAHTPLYAGDYATRTANLVCCTDVYYPGVVHTRPYPPKRRRKNQSSAQQNTARRFREL
jgi:hypothetical protein